MFLFEAGAQKRLFSASGSLIIQNYPPKTIRGNAQVFSITQDANGLMYFANQQGVLQYDGSNWQTIPTENNRIVNEVSTSKDGTILVGGDNIFGKLVSDDEGVVSFKSLKSILSDSSDIGLIQKIIIHENQVIIHNESKIFVLEEDSLINTITSETQYGTIILKQDNIYAYQKGLGIYVLNDTGLTPLKDGYLFSNKPVINIIHFNDKHLIVTEDQGLFEINQHDEIKPLHILEDIKITGAQNLENRLLSFGTKSKGIIVLNKALQITYELDLDKGLIDPFIKDQYYDNENNLWLATNNGISKVEIQSPIMHFGRESGLRTSVESITKFNGHIYAAAYDGVYQFNDGGQLTKLEGITNDCYNLQVMPYLEEYQVEISPIDSTELIVLHFNELLKIKKVDTTIVNLGLYSNITQSSTTEMFNFVVMDDGTIFIGTKPDEGVYKTHVDIFNDPTVPVKQYDLDIGATYTFEHDNTFFVAGDSGLFYMEGEKFLPSKQFGIDFSTGEYGVHRISKDPLGNIWMIIFDQFNYFEYGYSELQPDGTYNWNNIYFKRHAEQIVHAIYHEDRFVTWLGGTDGIIRFDKTATKKYNIDYKSLIRSVKFNNTPLYSGGAVEKMPLPYLEYQTNSMISFSFSAASYVDESNTSFSYILEGHSKNWSDWSDITYKEYNLQEGTYTFKVKAKNVYGVISEEASFTFTIAPPWYRRTWAYALFIVLTIGLIYLVVLLSLRRVKQQNIRLEQTVEDRTAEISAQKEEVEIQKEIVEEKNKDILDSIRYAKHIQDAILPSNEFLAQSFKDAFIFFKPKDIVSGDFYWVKKKGNKILFSVVDCTGHGVPGAFVSIVGNNSLNRAINEFNLSQPAAILDMLNSLVVESFKQQGTEDDVKDGMDIALCVLDTSTNILEYSGANNSLYLVRNGELIETRANKQPIGAYDHTKPFTNHTIQLQRKDRVFLFSDGYADQFGGPKGKKLKYKAFKNILINDDQVDLNTLNHQLSEQFLNWKGNLEQVDDVCILGVEI